MTEDGWSILPIVQPVMLPMGANQQARKAYVKGGSHAVNAEKKLWQESAFYAWKQARTQDVFARCAGVPCDVKLDIGFGVRRRRDPHNYVSTVCKWVIDGLVHAGAWEDDNPTWITVHEPTFSYYGKGQRTTLVYMRPRVAS